MSNAFLREKNLILSGANGINRQPFSALWPKKSQSS